MNVQMMHGLPAIISSVHYNSVSAVELLFIDRNIGCCLKKASKYLGLFCLINIRDVFFGNYQDMSGCLRGDVPNAHGLLVFVDDVGRDLFGDDFAEDAICFRTHEISLHKPVEDRLFVWSL